MSDVDIAFAGVARQAEMLRSGEVSSRELVQLCLDRIARHDPALNAFRVVLVEGALREADQADARRRGGDERPLLGVPFAVKDDTDLRGEVTTKGSIAHGGPAGDDAVFVRRLRLEGGAIAVGKTNVPELMTMPFTESPWYGATRNPWDLDRSPGGSSGGSAAAVAAGLVPAATGSDGAGSLRIPAACTGLVALKCQRGRIPTPPTWRGLNTYGFHTRTVADTALLCDLVRTGGGPSYLEAARTPPGRLRIAVSTKVPLGARTRPDGTQSGAVESTAATLRGLGHVVAERDPDFGLVGASVVTRYLTGIADDAAELPRPERLGRRSKGLVRLGAAIPRPLAARAVAEAQADGARIDRIFEHADVLVLPVITELPLRIGAFEAYGGARSLDAALRFAPWPGIYNHTGRPALAVPAARTEAGFPLGVQLGGPPDSEALLLSLAAQLEAAIEWPRRRPPQFS